MTTQLMVDPNTYDLDEISMMIAECAGTTSWFVISPHGQAFAGPLEAIARHLTGLAVLEAIDAGELQ